MRKIVLFLISTVLLLIASLGYANTIAPEQLRNLKAKEQQVIAYFSKEGQRVYDKNKSFYYRKLLAVNDEGSVVVQDFYTKTDTKQIDPVTLMDLKELYSWATNSIDGSFVLWYENGQKKQQGFYVKGKAEGPYLTWYKSGTKESESFYTQGKLQGCFTGWYESGSKKYEATYQEDKVEGTVSQWYENGQIKSLGLMIDGQLEGYFKTWYEDGKLQQESYFRNNKLDGLQKKWDQQGHLLYQRKYQQGHVVWPKQQV